MLTKTRLWRTPRQIPNAEGRNPKEHRTLYVQSFVILPRRWVVERTFCWLMRQRRLVRDYETTETSAEAWAYIAMIRIQLRRLA